MEIPTLIANVVLPKVEDLDEELVELMREKLPDGGEGS